MAAYYNEIDGHAAAWLRALIAKGELPDGDVDERPIEQVSADDLLGYTQHHFFAGIGGWPLALRRAGWPDERPVWTGSCPCQPFSQAGRREGFDDDRHLWPVFRDLIRQRRPVVVFGEQVSSRLGRDWVMRVQSDLEDLGFAVGAVDTSAACFGAPHIRPRLYWVADASAKRREQRRASYAAGPGPFRLDEAGNDPDGRRQVRVGLADPGCWGPEVAPFQPGVSASPHGEGEQAATTGGSGAACGLADSGLDGSQGRISRRPYTRRQALYGPVGHGGTARRTAASVARDTWGTAVWVGCGDGKSRRIEPGIEPLAHGVSGRVGLLRGYGNALCVPQAEAFVRAFRNA